jgi:hypothetical protein
VFPMDEYSFVAHALRDFLRPQLGHSDLNFIDAPLQCGEPVESIVASLSIAIEHAIPMPPVFTAHILAMRGLRDEDSSFLIAQIERLPRYEIAA